MSSCSCRRPPALGLGLVVLLAFTAAHAPSMGWAQETEPAALRLPGASEEPAAVLVGSSPAQVQRPREPVALAVALGSSVSSSGRGAQLPQALAVAVAPYWLRSRPGLSYAEYAQPGWRSVYRNLSVSLATRAVSVDASEGAPGEAAVGAAAAATTPAGATRLALGVRSLLLPGRADGDPAALRSCQEWARTASGRIAAAIAHELATDKLSPDSGSIEKRNQSLVAAELRRLPKGCDAQAEVRRGFVLELDLAASADFQGGRADAGSLRDGAAWVSGGYHGAHWSVDGLVRGALLELHDGAGPAQAELGVRVGRAWRRVGGWVEGLARRGLGTDAQDRHGYRAAVGLDLGLSEAVWLGLTFGRDFRAEDPESLLALANLRWEFRERRIEWLPGATP